MQCIADSQHHYSRLILGFFAGTEISYVLLLRQLIFGVEYYRFCYLCTQTNT